MYSSRELIDALLLRGRERLWFRADEHDAVAGEFPPGWRVWFDAMRERRGAVTGAPAEAILAILAAREPLPVLLSRSADLNRWQTFATLWRMHWEPAPPESRRDRAVGWFATVAIHALLALLWAWLLYVRVPPSPPARGDDSAVQAVFIGEGTPADAGAGAAQGDVPEQPPSAAAPAPAVSAQPTPSPAPQATPALQPEPEQAADVAVAQPLQATEPVQPDAAFVVPPTTPPEVKVQPVTRPQLVVVPRERNVELVERPTPSQVRAELEERPEQVTSVRRPEAQVRQREIPLVSAPVPMPSLQRPADQPTPRVQAPERAVRGRDIALEPAPASAATAPTATSGTQGARPDARDGRQGGQPDRASGNRTASQAGAGATPSSAPGAWPTPNRGDDWGEALQNRPGGNPGAGSGLFGADGRPRLPPGTAQPGGGFPPGSDNWTQALLDRHGTWAKRPPIGYDPTRFDRYWIPSGTLLQEWVRRGVKSMAIPIPGTIKRINCTISILQLGGGCGISDANLQDQEAIARPPPDVPFKPELQENQEALGTPPGG